MNNSSFKLDRQEGLVGDENLTRPVDCRGEDVFARNSNEVMAGESIHVSDEVRVRLGGVAIDSSGEVVSFDFSNERLSTGVEEARVSMELENRARVLERGRSDDVVSENGRRQLVDLSGEERVDFEDKGHTGRSIPADTAGARNDNRNWSNDSSGSRAGKGNLEGKHTMLPYDSLFSMFDNFTTSEGRDGGAGSKMIGYGYEIGDMVWGKVKSHPWWPGHIFNEAFALPAVRRTKREGHVLVAFFGDSSYGWFDPAELVPFDINFSEKSKQTNSKPFVKAVEEAIDEVSRRSGLGFACRCRNPFNFRPTDVQGYFSVDVGEFEAGAVYSVSQIKKARDSFRSRDTLSFVKRIAVARMSVDYESIHYIKNKANILAYRKAVFEEFDETYAQAFGVQPVRPPKPTEQPPPAIASRALSGPLVFAEDLGKRRNTVKAHKIKDEVKKDRYLFKRRDEQNETKTAQFNQVSSLSKSMYLEGFSASVAGGFVLQTRAPEASTKHEEMDVIRSSALPSNQGVKSEAVSSALPNYSASSQINSVKVESAVSYPSGQLPINSGPFIEGKSSEEEGRNVSVDMNSTNSAVQVMPSNVSVEGMQQVLSDSRNVQVLIEDGNSRIQLAGASSVKHCGDGSRLQIDSGVKKMKVHKRAAGEMSANSVLVAKKKKRKKEMTMQVSSDHMPRHTGKAVQSIMPISGSLKVHQLTEVDQLKSYPSPDVGALQTAGIGNIELDFPQILGDLYALALSPFHSLEKSPAVMSKVVLRFRSIVFQKSLASLAPAENEMNETSSSKLSALYATPNNFPIVGTRDLPLLKASRPPVKPNDPTKGGRARGPSDRQEEMAAKKLKKISDLKSLKAEKKTTQKAPDAKDRKDNVGQAPSKASRLASTKKLPPTRVPEPTMLVMKFPPQGTLPSIPELKARFARFGLLDHSATRAFWKSSTCRVVFRYKNDAQAAYKYACVSNNLFGHANVRCFLREMDGPASEPESASKVQREDASIGSPKSKEPVSEQRPPTILAVNPSQQQPVQLKSCLKKSSGDEGGVTNGGNSNINNGGGRGTPRVKFMLGGEESNRKEQVLMVGNKNNDASFADDGASSSSPSSHSMDFNTKNLQQNIIPPSPSSMSPFHPPSLYPKATLNFPYAEVVPRNSHNSNTSLGNPKIDISQQMLGLLIKCNDIVTNVSGFLGYVPYHSL